MHPSSRFFGLFFLIASLFLYTSMYLPAPQQELNGLYVNGFKYILGQPDKEKELLEFAQSEGFNYLLFYNLPYIHRHMYDLGNAESAKVLADFIYLAKTKYGIQEVGAVGETSEAFEGIYQYNKRFGEKTAYRIDAYNLEFEFWNNDLVDSYYCPTYIEDSIEDCDEEDAFRYYLRNLEAISKKAHASQLKCETYIGLPSQSQCQKIGTLCDRVLVHYYRKSDVYNNGNSIYQYHDYRLPALAPKDGVLEVMPIFSARENHLGPWLDGHDKKQVYQTYQYGKNGYQEMNGKWKEHLHIPGAQWYRYTNLVKLFEE